LKDANKPPALNRSMGHARTRGTDIERDHQGLPFHMTMPAGHGHCNPVQRSSHKRVPSHGYFYTPGNTRLSTGPVWPGKPTGPSQEDSSSDSSASYYSAHEDSEADDNPPPGLLTQLEFDGIDDPRQTIPSKYRSSHGKLPKIRTSGEAEAFAARRAKSPSRPQVPDDAPPPYLKTQTDKDVYRAICHTAGPLILLDYFNSLPPLPPSLDQESHEGPVAAPSADNGVVPNEPVAQTEGGNFSFPPLLPVPDREIGDISKSTKLLADGAAPNEPVVQVGFGGFVREKVVLCPFQRSDNLRHPKDPYVTGHRSGKLVLL